MNTENVLMLERIEEKMRVLFEIETNESGEIID